MATRKKGKLYLLGVVLWFIVMFYVAARIIAWFFTSIIVLPVEQWQLLGDVSRNTNALAVFAASIAAYIAWRTNQSRAREAVRSDFKDRINWAAQNYTGDPTLTSIAAGRFIDNFAKSNTLHPEDLATAKTLSAKKQEIAQDRERKMEVVLKALLAGLDNYEALAETTQSVLSKRDTFNDTLEKLIHDLEKADFEHSIIAAGTKQADTLESLTLRYYAMKKHQDILVKVAKHLLVLEDRDTDGRVKDDPGTTDSAR